MKGVRGWLLVFVILQIIRGMIIALAGLFFLFDSEMSWIPYCLLLLGLAFLISTVLLIRQHRAAVRIAKGVLCAELFFLLVLYGVEVSSLSSSRESGALLASYLPFSLFAIVWLIYLSRSKRVMQTYPQKNVLV